MSVPATWVWVGPQTYISPYLGVVSVGDGVIGRNYARRLKWADWADRDRRWVECDACGVGDRSKFMVHLWGDTYCQRCAGDLTSD